MAAAEPRIRNYDWEEDEILKADLEKYVLQSLLRKEILDFVKRDFPHYAWSLGTLSRRLVYFDNHKICSIQHRSARSRECCPQ